MRIRRASDIETVRALHTILFPDTFFEGPELGNVYWIAWNDVDEPVGFCSVRPIRPTCDEPRWSETAILSRAGVLPGYRGRGLQRRFISLRIKWARSVGFSRCVSYTLRSEPTTSARNLVRSGFLPYKPAVMWATEDVDYWEKEL